MPHTRLEANPYYTPRPAPPPPATAAGLPQARSEAQAPRGGTWAGAAALGALASLTLPQMLQLGWAEQRQVGSKLR